MLGARDPAASGAVLVGLAVHEEGLVVEDVGDVLVAAHCAVLINVDIGHEVLELLVGGSASKLFLQESPDLRRIQHTVPVRVQRRKVLAQRAVGSGNVRPWGVLRHEVGAMAKPHEHELWRR